MKHKIYFTLKLAKEYEACSNGLNKFLSAYPTTTEDEDINILKLLESNGVEHAMWALRCTTADSEEATKSVCVEIAKRAAARAKEYWAAKAAADAARYRAIKGDIHAVCLIWDADTTNAQAAASYAEDAARYAAAWAETARNPTYYAKSARYAISATDWAAAAASYAAAWAVGTATKSERKKQKQDFLELLE